MDADPATLTEPERRVALLDWLARGRDVRIAAELCGEKHDWAKAVAAAAGHPDRDQIRQALAAAKSEGQPRNVRPCGCPWPGPRRLDCAVCLDPVPPAKPDSIAPTRPAARPGPIDDMTVEQIVELIGTDDGGDADLPEVTECLHANRSAVQRDAPEQPPEIPGRRRKVARTTVVVCPDCGTEWTRQHCDDPSCTDWIAAEFYARTGLTRHLHHPKDPS